MIGEGKTTRQIDEAAHVDDSYALRGLTKQKKEISQQATASANEVNSSLHASDDTINRVGGTILALVISMIFLSIWLMLSQVIAPVKRLTGLMTKLADNRLDVKVDGLEWTNEMGAMARAVNIFKENALQRKYIEEQLEESNNSLNLEIKQVEKLRKDAQEQTRKAMSLADNLADAHVAAERARSQAESKHHEIKMILNTVKDAIICADQDGKIICQ